MVDTESEKKSREALAKAKVSLLQDDEDFKTSLEQIYSIYENSVSSSLLHNPDIDYEAEFSKHVSDFLDTRLGGGVFIEGTELAKSAITYLNRSIRDFRLSGEDRGLRPEEFLDALNANLKDFFSDAKLKIRAFGPDATAILEDGEFKTQHETGYSGGGSYEPEMRSVVEKVWFGNSLKNPVYGYWHSPRKDNSLEDLSPSANYGGVVFTLKPEVKYRATATMGDSLVDREVSTPFIPTAPLSLDSFINVKNAINSIEYKGPENFFMTNRFGYMEAQVHGGVTHEDIEKVTIYNRSIRHMRPDVLTDLKTVLNARGIPYEIVD
jgi:hypothetical protein